MAPDDIEISQDVIDDVVSAMKSAILTALEPPPVPEAKRRYGTYQNWAYWIEEYEAGCCIAFINGSSRPEFASAIFGQDMEELYRKCIAEIEARQAHGGGDEIAMLTKKAAMSQPRLTQSVIQRWLHDMIGAGWCFRISVHDGDDNTVFYHADKHDAIVSYGRLESLCKLYWETGKIPDPYNVDTIS